MTQAGQRLTAAWQEHHVEVEGFRIRYWESGPPRPVGAVVMLLGVVLLAVGRLYLPIERLPGDIVYRGRNTTVYVPLATSLLVSVVPFFTGAAGSVYLAGATVLGVGLLTMAVLDLGGRRWTRRLFGYTIVYVAALFGLFAASPFLG